MSRAKGCQVKPAAALSATRAPRRNARAELVGRLTKRIFCIIWASGSREIAPHPNYTAPTGYKISFCIIPSARPRGTGARVAESAGGSVGCVSVGVF